MKKKREFENYLHLFYEKIINPSINDIQQLINNFIENENILQKTNEKFDRKRQQFIDDSNKQKNKINIMVIGPTGSGKSTLINEILNLSDENKAKEGVGDSQTMDFKIYNSDNSNFSFIDTQGFDYSKPISEFSKVLQLKIKKYNENPSTFIDMIYYCTNNMTRFQTQEFQVIKELKKLFNLDRVPLIIVFTQCYFQSDYIKMKDFIEDNYKDVKLSILRVVAREKENFPACGINELKEETKTKIENFKENAYARKFIANVSQILYKDYKDNFLSSFIKGIFEQKKEKSINNLFKTIFNMYRFENNDLSENDMNEIIRITDNYINDYNNNLNDLTKKIIDLHSESCIIKENRLDCNMEISDEYLIQKDEKKSYLIENDFETFKNDIDEIIFPSCIDVIKIELIQTFNKSIFKILEPKIKQLMAYN